MRMATAVKQHGRVYTPDYLVKIILDFGKYNSVSILQKHVIDNSCGDGAFLSEIVNSLLTVAATRLRACSIICRKSSKILATMVMQFYYFLLSSSYLFIEQSFHQPFLHLLLFFQNHLLYHNLLVYRCNIISRSFCEKVIYV